MATLFDKSSFLFAILGFGYILARDEVDSVLSIDIGPGIIAF